MSCPRRTIVAEPFASQMETIDRALIEVQNQPMQYYGRRNNTNTTNNNNSNNNIQNNNMKNRQTGAGIGPASGLHASLGLAAGAHHQMNQQGKKSGNYNGNFQGNMNGNINGNSVGNSAGSVAGAHYSKYGYYNPATNSSPIPDLYGNGFRTTQSTNAKHQQQQQNLASPALAPSSAEYGAGNGFLLNSALPTSSGVQSTVSHIPQVFNDDAQFSPAPNTVLGNNPGDSPGHSEARKVDAFATFDPFGSDFSGFNGQSSLFSPVFNSSTKILGSGYASPATSSNIWGSNAKSMTGDAAVWG